MVMQPGEFEAMGPVIQDELGRRFPDSKFMFQLERGNEAGRLHYQGHINLKTKKRTGEFCQQIAHMMPGIHAAPSSKAGAKDAEFYCMKEETRLGGPWADKDHIFPDFTDLVAPYGWQIQAHAILTGAIEKRSIYWIWEETGCTGKSDFCTWMEVHHKIIGLGLGTANDNFYAVSELTARGYIFDIPRTLPIRFDWAEVYMSLEKIKDRNFLSTKYKPKKVLLPVIPHVMVFSNYPPTLASLSLDRWKVFKIINGELIPQ